MLSRRSEKNIKVAMIWGKWGPYHYARFSAFATMWGEDRCIGIALAGKSSNYQWKEVGSENVYGKVVTLNEAKNQETLSPYVTALKIYRILKREKVQVAFIPSYWPARAFAVLLAAKIAGIRCVMMNESHAGTERASGFAKWVKKRLIGLFNAGLVGGTPQVEYFEEMGMSRDRLFVGYDVVDNTYFSKQAAFAKANEKELRIHLGLPNQYILNLGRMVEKKNLSLLIEAYAKLVNDPLFSTNTTKQPALVLIGSGKEEEKLRSLALILGLKVSNLISGEIPEGNRTVFFGGFRDIDENAIFFSLATMFVLPSSYEEWGLVVNEAMASGQPVLVSSNAGCARDLVKDEENGFHFPPDNAELLKEKMLDILRDERLRNRMGDNSVKMIQQWGCDLFASNASNAVLAALQKK